MHCYSSPLIPSVRLRKRSVFGSDSEEGWQICCFEYCLFLFFFTQCKSRKFLESRSTFIFFLVSFKTYTSYYKLAACQSVMGGHDIECVGISISYLAWACLRNNLFHIHTGTFQNRNHKIHIVISGFFSSKPVIKMCFA